MPGENLEAEEHLPAHKTAGESALAARLSLEREGPGTVSPAEESPGPLLSIVVPACNEARRIGRCLASIHQAVAEAGLAGPQFELLVVDNASDDNTAALAASGGARVVYETKRQIARARNAGAAQAKGRWLLFVDADSWPHGGLMAAMVERMACTDCIGGGTAVRMTDIPLSVKAVVAGWNLLSRSLNWAAGSFVFCRRDAFRAVGGFSRNLYVAEEIDLSIKLQRFGANRGQQFQIIRGQPLLTSSRKVRLYSPWELGLVTLQMLRHPRRFFRDPTICYPWYDGRR